jgi:hypothetical protein
MTGDSGALARLASATHDDMGMTVSFLGEHPETGAKRCPATIRQPFRVLIPASRIREQFDLGDGFDFKPRYNIAPTMKALAVHPRPHGERVASTCLWGPIP